VDFVVWGHCWPKDTLVGHCDSSGYEPSSRNTGNNEVVFGRPGGWELDGIIGN
jgi:hypothetical protein